MGREALIDFDCACWKKKFWTFDYLHILMLLGCNPAKAFPSAVAQCPALECTEGRVIYIAAHAGFRARQGHIKSVSSRCFILLHPLKDTACTLGIAFLKHLMLTLQRARHSPTHQPADTDQSFDAGFYSRQRGLPTGLGQQASSEVM